MAYNPPVGTPDGTPEDTTSPSVDPNNNPTSIPGVGLDPKMLQNIMSLLGIGGQFGAAALQQGQLNKGYDFLKAIADYSKTQNVQNLTNAGQAYGGQNAALNGVLSGQSPWSQMLSQGLMGNIQTLNNLLPGLVQPGQNQAPYQGLANNQIYQDPNSTNALRGITDLTGNTSGILNKASELLNSGGITNTQVPLGQYAQALMNGVNPNQMALQGTGTSILGNNGMTPALASALQTATGVVQGGGQSDLTNKLAQKGLDLSSQNPLLSGADAASIAQDQSGRNFANMAKNAREQATLRGGGPGAISGNGIGNGTLADFGDQALSQTAQAAQNARLGQQSLGLSQQNQGLNTALSAAGIQNQGLLGGLGAITGLTGAQTGQLGTGGSLVNSAAQLGNNGASFYNQLLGLQQGNMQQGFNAGLGATGAQQSLLQTAIQDLMQGQNNSAATGNSLANLYLQNQGQLAGGINQGLSGDLNAAGQLGQQGSNWLSAAMQALGQYGNTGSSVANLLKQPNAYATTINNLGGALGGSGVNLGGIKLPNITLKTGSNGLSDTGGGFDFSGFFNQSPIYGGPAGSDPYGINNWMNSPFFTDPSYGNTGGNGNLGFDQGYWDHFNSMS